MIGKKYLNIEFLEKKIISQKNRFRLSNQENQEIKKLFKN